MTEGESPLKRPRVAVIGYLQHLIYAMSPLKIGAGPECPEESEFQHESIVNGEF
jgi:hypothetical protein